jgi:hypothetical protein
MNEIRTINPTGVHVEAAETMPHSIEAEQQLLGAILTDNDIYDRVASIIGAGHFYDPVHTRIYEIATARISKNNLASPVTLKAFMEDDEGLKELGGPAYLARLAASAISTFAVRDYAQMSATRRPRSMSPLSRANRSSRRSRPCTNWPSRARRKAGFSPFCAPSPMRSTSPTPPTSAKAVLPVSLPA